MMNSDELNASLRGKSPQEQARVAQSLIAASKESRFRLIPAEMRALSEFVVHIYDRHPVDDALLLTVSDLVQRYEEHLMARARGHL